MNGRYRVIPIGSVLMALLAALIGLIGCQSASAPTPASTPLPTLTLDETSAEDFAISDFDAVHSPVNGDANERLIFGNIPVSKPAADLAPDLAVFLGRWEGYDFGPPVKKDRKLVMVVQEITALGGTAYAWSGANLQYPDIVKQFHFRVFRGDAPAIEWKTPVLGGGEGIATFTYDQEKEALIGSLKDPTGTYDARPYQLTRSQSLYVYKDYAEYLASRRITSQTYQNSELEHYGAGYLLYLPEGYEDNPDKTWPLLFFLHGYGDRGDNTLVLAKASPFMYIREQKPLPFIIAAPLLSTNAGYSSFPDEYMDGVLAELQAAYRVDAKRIYVTGLSMGGEATYRFAVHQPDTFAAIAPLSAYVDSETYSRLGLIKDLPVWAIHGADDSIISLESGQQPVDALKEAGSNIRFTVLQGHDHDTWTDTYSDPAFYDWFLQYTRP